MLNIAKNSPPNELVIGGDVYPINTDYRVGIEVSELLRKSNSENADNIWQEIQKLIFGGEVYCDTMLALEAITIFLAGYPHYDNGYSGSSRDQEQLYSFVYDINLIVLAIRNQTGIDISYNCKHFHWWLFLLEFKSLEEHHEISRIIQMRGYKGKDEEYLRLKRQMALPYEYSEEEERQAEELNSIFYNC